MKNPFINGALARLFSTYTAQELEEASLRYTPEEWELIMQAMHKNKGGDK